MQLVMNAANISLFFFFFFPRMWIGSFLKEGAARVLFYNSQQKLDGGFQPNYLACRRNQEFRHLANSIANIVPCQKTGHLTHCSYSCFWTLYSKVLIIRTYGFKINPITGIILKTIIK